MCVSLCVALVCVCDGLLVPVCLLACVRAGVCVRVCVQDSQRGCSVIGQQSLSARRLFKDEGPGA